LSHPRKSPSRRALAAAIALYAPSLERLQHGRIAPAGQMLDDRGVLSAPLRAESMLERMCRLGDIGAAEVDAGEMFQGMFRLAHLDPLQAADMLREGRSAFPQGTTGIERARNQVHSAMQALGGHGSPCGSAIWYVLGNEITVTEWARREGWGGKPLRPEVAKGTLIGALGVLVKHFGL
jgi:hypothetical protein